MKRDLPPSLAGRKNEPDALDQFVKGEIAKMGHLELVALSPDRSIEERRAAIAETRGICLRLGSMLLKSPEIEAEGTVAGRSKVAQQQELIDKRLREIIAEAEKVYPPGRRGRKTAIDSYVAEKMKVSEKTASRHRKKMRTL